MIFSAEALLGIVAHHAANLGIPLTVDHAMLQGIVTEAERLAGGHMDDEPAALFYAGARRAGRLGKVANPFLDKIATAQADAVGLVLHANELDLVMLRGRIAFGTVGWDDVRLDFASWLSPPASHRVAPLQSARAE